MAVPLLGRHRKIPTSKFPMEGAGSLASVGNDHVIDIRSSSEASSSNPPHNRVSNEQQQSDNLPSTSTRTPVFQPSLSTSRGGSNIRSSSLNRRENGRNRQRSPLSSGIWISVELVLTVSQIIAAIVVLALSRHEHPHAPLVVWVVGYASGCVAILPLLYWRYHHRHQGSDRESSQSNSTSTQNELSAAPSSGTSDRDSRRSSGYGSQGAHNVGALSLRLKVLVEYFKMALDCFFAVWFVVGNVWIFGGHSSSADAPNLYRICIVFLTFSCIGYAMPFIFCATICCCLPCIIRVMGFREDTNQSRGATTESINSLPTYKFKTKKNKSNDKENNSGGIEGGIVAAGTEKERFISGEDAVCCICLAKYAHNDELRELPCTHFFHKECVDKWLKINAACPLCKAEVGETVLQSVRQAVASL
ncbi:OLC1v1030154C1 [Oldenlandia corymbosa var. corymbosa]|uniref:OLC1v1030154C1 n=1 Tax=Oldenlandia corymbosa var. corymbosa TaxID=529605 RepID=A0AAV1CG60_OLDCO|nr:OLC1v1030154C1 [Oldenlandia corymbosa var. corymbosa]